MDTEYAEFSCKACQYDQEARKKEIEEDREPQGPSLQEQQGCEEPTQAAVWVDKEERFYFNCPLKFVPKSIWEWYDQYAYYLKFPGAAPRYWDQIPRFVEAIFEYENALKEYADMKKDTDENKDGKNPLEALRGIIKRRKKDG